MRLIVQMGQGIAHKDVPIISVISVYKEKHRVLWTYIMQRGEEDSGLVSQSVRKVFPKHMIHVQTPGGCAGISQAK